MQTDCSIRCSFSIPGSSRSTDDIFEDVHHNREELIEVFKSVMSFYPSRTTQTRKLLWREASAANLEDYQKCLEMDLQNRIIPAEAAVCNDPERCWHRAVIQEYYDGLECAMIRSASKCIPKGKCFRSRKVWCMHGMMS